MNYGPKTFLYHLPLVRLLFELPCKLAERHAVLLRVLVVQPHQQGPAWGLETHCHQLVDGGGAHLVGKLREIKFNSQQKLKIMIFAVFTCPPVRKEKL